MNEQERAEEHLHFEETDVGARGIARVYAEALLDAAEKENQAPDRLADLQTLVGQVFPAHPELETFLASGAVNRESKSAALAPPSSGGPTRCSSTSCSW